MRGWILLTISFGANTIELTPDVAHAAIEKKHDLYMSATEKVEDLNADRIPCMKFKSSKN